MAITVAEYLRLQPRIARDLGLASREATNEAALAVTQKARRALQGAIGAEQRLSGVRITSSWTVVDGQRVHGQAQTGGIKINPAYKEADSVTRPVALIGVRGPAQYIEHPRRGGYEIAVVASRRSSGAPTRLDATFGEFFAGAVERVESGAADRRPALHLGGSPVTGFRYHVRGGAITTPIAPITKTFERAPAAVHELVDKAVHARIRRNGWGD